MLGKVSRSLPILAYGIIFGAAIIHCSLPQNSAVSWVEPLFLGIPRGGAFCSPSLMHIMKLDIALSKEGGPLHPSVSLKAVWLHLGRGCHFWNQHNSWCPLQKWCLLPAGMPRGRAACSPSPN